MDKEKSISLIRLILILAIIGTTAYFIKTTYDRITSHPNYPANQEVEHINTTSVLDTIPTPDRFITYLSIDSPSLEERLRSRYIIDSIFSSMNMNYIIPFRSLQAEYGNELVAMVYKDINENEERTERYSYGRRIGRGLSEYPYQFKHRNN